MTPEEKMKQQATADKLRPKFDPFKSDPAMVKDPEKLREKQQRGFPTIKAEAPDYLA